LVQQDLGPGRRSGVIPESVTRAAAPPWPAALVAVYTAERTDLVRAAFLICGSVASAEDAVHDALARVAARWHAVENGRSYLYVAVVNAGRDIARRDERSRRFVVRRHVASPGPDLANVSADALALHAALSRLAVNHRAAIVLRFFLDWDDDEIAERFGVKPATVRSWVHRGVTSLRRELER
jgi:RNA polymerase sigma factor (sigma-70 family)